MCRIYPRSGLRTLIGDRHGARAIDLSMPVMIAPMSYGALSAGMKQALGLASHLSGIADNTGEGGMYSVERARGAAVDCPVFVRPSGVEHP